MLDTWSMAGDYKCLRLHIHRRLKTNMPGVLVMKYKGREIVNPVIILIRLVCFPLLYVVSAVQFALIAVGWGIDSAIRVWKDVF